MMRALFAAILCSLTFSAACAPSSPAGQGPAAQAPSSRGPTMLRIALQGFEEPNRDGIMGYGSAAGFDPLEHYLTFHAPLTVYDPQGNLMPRLAEKVPSLQDGDWKTFPDGHMEVTWRLRPGLTWHDGAPLLAKDFALGAQIVNDGDVPVSRPTWARLISHIQTPDDRTLVLAWREPSFLAGGNGASDVPAMPTHILADRYGAGDKQTFINDPYWTTEFVGLGPYRLVGWQRGSFIEGAAFDGFVLGRPKIDRILLSYAGDVNTIVAGVLSGDIEMVPMGARMDASQLAAVQDGWGPTGGSTLLVPFGIRTIWLQFRDAGAPWVRDVRVRRALSHATDRQGMSDALQYGLTPPADTFVPIEDGAYRLLQSRSFARFPFDPARARALFGEAGWTLAGDGLLRDAATRLLAMDVAATAQGGNVQEIETVSSQWHTAGVDAHPAPIPPQSANIDERKNTVAGGFMWPWTPNLDAPQNLTAAQVATERASWKGRNYTGYSNPAYDELYSRFIGTLDMNERQGIVADMMALIADEIPVIPVYYYGNGVIARKGLDGPGMITPLQTASTWNISTWELH